MFMLNKQYKIMRFETYHVLIEAESEVDAMDKLYEMNQGEWTSDPDATEVWAEEADYV